MEHKPKTLPKQRVRLGFGSVESKGWSRQNAARVVFIDVLFERFPNIAGQVQAHARETPGGAPTRDQEWWARFAGRTGLSDGWVHRAIWDRVTLALAGVDATRIPVLLEEVPTTFRGPNPLTETEEEFLARARVEYRGVKRGLVANGHKHVESVRREQFELLARRVLEDTDLKELGAEQHFEPGTARRTIQRTSSLIGLTLPPERDSE